jgi:hypothetical protein
MNYNLLFNLPEMSRIVFGLMLNFECPPHPHPFPTRKKEYVSSLKKHALDRAN